MVRAGDGAPDFSLPSTDGEVRLSEMLERGRVLLAFYTEDGTPSCSTEVSALRDAHEMLKDAGTRVIAVSADSIESHGTFAKRLGGLPFALASDEQLYAARAYGVTSDENHRRSRRALFVIERDGTILYAADPFQVSNVTQLEEALRAAGVEL